jgi:hypothetical protein
VGGGAYEFMMSHDVGGVSVVCGWRLPRDFFSEQRMDRAVGALALVEKRTKNRPGGIYVMGGAGATESRAEFERISTHRRSGRDPGCAYALHTVKLACVSMHASPMC